ncbi:MAG: hypothetical protein HYY06_14135 [Deltaproteobacteria bacterium]|nr:hypothetical protein [Deltaproteobacteria bacterium]
MRPLVCINVACAVSLASTAAIACSYSQVFRADVVPMDGSAGVPTNAEARILYVGIDLYALDDETAGALMLRPVGGDAITATVEVSSLAGGIVVTARPEAPLAPLTQYEVLDWVDDSQCSDELGCRMEEPVVVSRFTTGDSPDDQPPEFAGLTGFGTEAAACDESACCGPYRVITARPSYDPASDDGPEGSIRYRLYSSDGPALSPVAVGHSSNLWGFIDCDGGALGDDEIGRLDLQVGDYVVRAVDLAGNEDANEIIARLDASCEDAELEDTDGGEGDDLDDLDDGGGEGASCAMTPGRGGTATSAVVACAVLAGIVRRRPGRPSRPQPAGRAKSSE